MGKFEIKETCVEFVINKVSVQGNNFKIKLNLTVEEICRVYIFVFCEMNGIVPGFYLVLSGIYSEPSETSNIERFTKIHNG